MNAGRQALEKQFANEGIGVGRHIKLVSEELLHASEELTGLAVAELFATDELLEFALLRSCGLFDEFALRVSYGLSAGQQIADLHRELWAEGADHVLEPGFLRGDTPGGKLSPDLTLHHRQYCPHENLASTTNPKFCP